MVKHRHDSLMRVVFSDPERAGEMLEFFLGAELSTVVDFKKLEPIPGRFADEDLKQHEADLLFSSRAEGGEALIYVLLEHQSTPEETMALRLLRYVTRIHGQIGVKNMKAGTVPPIYPVVLYQGLERWPHPLSIGELYHQKSLPPGGRLPLESHFTLINLQDVADEHLESWARRGQPAVSLALLSMKYAGRRDFLSMLEVWGDIVKAVYRAEAGRRLMATFLNYFLAVADTHHGQLAQILIPMTEPKVGKMIKTAAERLIEEGMEKGLKRGRREGERRGEARALVRLLEKRFGLLTEETRRRIAAASVEELTVFLDRVLDAHVLDEVFDQD